MVLCCNTSHEPTRLRLNEKENILDLAFTNKLGILSDLKILPGIGKSDHKVITFTLHCSYQQESKPKIKLMYNKANFTAIREDLTRNWKDMFEGKPVHECWEILIQNN